MPRRSVRLAVRALTAGLLVSTCGVVAAAYAQPATPAPSPAAATPATPAAQTAPRFGIAEPIAKPDGAVRLATYNVENLFDDKDDPTLKGKNEDKDMTKPEAHRKAAADAIRRINADIIALEEVESKEAVLWFRDAYLSDLGYEHVASLDAGDERGIEQAVLSRFPITEVKNWPGLPLGGTHPEKWGKGENFNKGQPITFHRSPLCVTVTVSGIAPALKEEEKPSATPAFKPTPYTLTLFVVHQKSGKEGEYWREKEAAKTVELVAALQKEDPARNIAILGDFNATLGSPSMRIYTDAGLLDAFTDPPPASATPGSTPAAPIRPSKDAATTTHESGRAIDRIFMNAAMAPEFIRGTRFVLGMPARPQGADWRSTPPPEGYASDHYPVVVDLVAGDR